MSEKAEILARWPIGDLIDEVLVLREEVKMLREILQATRDHLKFLANSEGGLVVRIDQALRVEEEAQ